MRGPKIPLGFLLLFSACVPGPSRAPREAAPFRPVQLVDPGAWPVLDDDLDAASFETAARRSAAALKAGPQRRYTIGDRIAGTQLLVDTLERLADLRAEFGAGPELTRALKREFDLYAIRRSTESHSAHFSSYYQPVVEAARTRTAAFRYPLFRKPPDLIAADLGPFDPALSGKTAVGRVDPAKGFVPYFDRRDIDVRGALEGKGLEIAWLKDPFDRLNLHIQGSGLLRFADGTEAMAAFSATNARPYKSVGLTVVGSGAMTREELTAATLKNYLKEHPEGEAWLISQNPRYTFFELRDLPAGSEPSGSLGRPLTPGRSIAIDPEVVPLGAAAYMSFPMAQADGEGRFLGKGPVRRFAFCQDTGGAIKGPGRVDVYVGHGPRASGTAHNVWDKGDLYILLKKLPPRDR